MKELGLRNLPLGTEMRAQLRELLEVDPASPSGLRWRVRPRGNVPAGSPAGTLDSGGYYWQVGVDHRRYKAHRLIWALTHDKDPGDHEIDHIDGRPSNNDPANLRLATKNENQYNGKRPRHNTSGYKGVSRRSRKAAWEGKVRLHGKRISKAFFDSKHGGTESALAAAAEWVTAKREELHGAFARHE